MLYTIHIRYESISAPSNRKRARTDIHWYAFVKGSLYSPKIPDFARFMQLLHLSCPSHVQGST
eukprot:7681278-Pyramimonas_sp.AAC.1